MRRVFVKPEASGGLRAEKQEVRRNLVCLIASPCAPAGAPTPIPEPGAHRGRPDRGTKREAREEARARQGSEDEEGGGGGKQRVLLQSSPPLPTPSALSFSFLSLSALYPNSLLLTCSGPRASWCAWTWACAWARPSRRAGGRLRRLRASSSEPEHQQRQRQQRPKSAARRWTSAPPPASGARPGPRSRCPRAPGSPTPSPRAWPWLGVLSLSLLRRRKEHGKVFSFFLSI